MNNANLSFISAVAVFFLVVGCSRSSEDRSVSIKQKQYFLKGEQLYLRYCSNCHQEDGKGLGRLYPPIADSDFVKENSNEIICLMRYGIEGELIVNGITYNMAMPPNLDLTDLDIAQIATYILNSWGHNKGLIDVKTVSPLLDSCR